MKQEAERWSMESSTGGRRPGVNPEGLMLIEGEGCKVFQQGIQYSCWS